MFKIRKVGVYKEVKVKVDNIEVDLGLLNEDQCRLLAYELKCATRNLLPENEDLEFQLATACDTLNTWAREQGVEECKDPYKNYGLRRLVERLWEKVNGKLYG
jgi:hypothetical protein